MHSLLGIYHYWYQHKDISRNIFKMGSRGYFSVLLPFSFNFSSRSPNNRQWWVVSHQIMNSSLSLRAFDTKNILWLSVNSFRNPCKGPSIKNNDLPGWCVLGAILSAHYLPTKESIKRMLPLQLRAHNISEINVWFWQSNLLKFFNT